MVNTQDSKTSIFTRFTQIGHLRDSLLIGAGILYILGFAAWSFNAWFNGLGWLPALDAQYFVAGIIPLLIILLVYFIIHGSIWFRNKYSFWFKKNVLEEKNKFLFYCAICLMFAFILMFIIFPYTILPDDLRIEFRLYDSSYYNSKYIDIMLSPWGLLMGSLGVLFLIFIPGRYHIDIKESKLVEKIYMIPVLCIYALVIGVSAFSVFFNSVYPNIPQEFGGVRPRPAYLEIIQNQTSTNTLLEIFPDDSLKTDDQVIRTKTVDVYYSSNDITLVKLHGLKGRETPTYEINQSIIKSIIWCSQ